MEKDRSPFFVPSSSAVCGGNTSRKDHGSEFGYQRHNKEKHPTGVWQCLKCKKQADSSIALDRLKCLPRGSVVQVNHPYADPYRDAIDDGAWPMSAVSSSEKPAEKRTQAPEEILPSQLQGEGV